MIGMKRLYLARVKPASINLFLELCKTNRA
jgi:hypothetical protein